MFIRNEKYLSPWGIYTNLMVLFTWQSVWTEQARDIGVTFPLGKTRNWIHAASYLFGLIYVGLALVIFGQPYADESYQFVAIFGRMIFDLCSEFINFCILLRVKKD